MDNIMVGVYGWCMVQGARRRSGHREAIRQHIKTYVDLPLRNVTINVSRGRGARRLPPTSLFCESRWTSKMFVRVFCRWFFPLHNPAQSCTIDIK